jgi:alpha-glucosidase
VAQGDWWRHGVVYQIYPRSLQDSDGDGIGDLAGIVSRLDYLNDGTPASLGIDAIWLSPFYPSPMVDFGYDVADYTDVHPDFGTLADFDVLLAEAHRRGIRVIIDLVPNHLDFRTTRLLRPRPCARRRFAVKWADLGVQAEIWRR